MSKANILTKKRNENFKTIYLEPIQSNEDLSWKAKGLWTYLISRPQNNWEFYFKDLVNRSEDGRTAVKSAMKELKEAGLLRIEQMKDEEGKFFSIWTIAESPEMIENPPPDNPGSDNPGSDNQQGTKKYSSKKKHTKKKKDNVSGEPENDSLEYSDDSPPIEATRYLIERIKGFNSKTPVPDKIASSKMQRWAKAMDRLHRLGAPGGDEGYSWQEIKNIIDYVFDEDDFWPEQIQSATGLRKKIIKLENKYKKNIKKHEKKNKSGTKRTFVERDPETGEYKEKEANV